MFISSVWDLFSTQSAKEYIKINIKAYSSDFIKGASITLLAVGTLGMQKGMRCLTAGFFSYFIYKENLYQNSTKLSQLAVITGHVVLPLLSLSNSTASHLVFPLYAFMAFTALQKDQTMDKMLKAYEEEVCTLKTLSRKSADAFKALENQAANVKTALEELLERKQTAGENLEKDPASLSYQLEEIANLCRIAKDSQEIKNQLLEVDHNTQKLSQLTEACRLESQKIEVQTEKLKQLTNQLEAIIDGALDQESQTKQILEDLRHMVKSFSINPLPIQVSYVQTVS